MPRWLVQTGFPAELAFALFTLATVRTSAFCTALIALGADPETLHIMGWLTCLCFCASPVFLEHAASPYRVNALAIARLVFALHVCPRLRKVRHYALFFAAMSQDLIWFLGGLKVGGLSG